MQHKLKINGEDHRVEAEPDLSLMSTLRNVIGLTGTKYGCAIGECGACTVNVDGKAVKSCQMTLEELGDKSVVTIEGFAAQEPDHAILKAWRDLEVSQCGYCQPGMIMDTAALLRKNSNPSRADISNALDGICRCGTYPRIFEAVERAAAELRGEAPEPIGVFDIDESPASVSDPDYRAQQDVDGRTFKPHPWVEVSESGRVLILGPAAELGQGGATAVPMMFAEEFDVDWTDVVVSHSPVNDELFGNPVPWAHSLMITVGSSTTPNYFLDARRKGTVARRVMIEAAAGHWAVSPDALITEPSAVVNPDNGNRLTYGEIAAFAKAPDGLPQVDDGKLKDPGDFRIIGRNQMRPDLPSKLDGTAVYAIDVALPGMGFARLLRPPVKNAKPAIFSDEQVLQQNLPVTVVELPDGYGVVADNYELAWYGAHSLQFDWADAEGSLFSDQEELERQMVIAKDYRIGGFPMQSEGDVDAIAENNEMVSADYRTDFLYQAHIEPLAAVARWSDDQSSLEVWAGTQAPSHCVRALAKAFDLNEDNITLYRTYMGGGFGRRAAADQDWVVDTARMAKAAKRPVKLIFAREDDLAFGRFKPITAHHLRASVDSDGVLEALHHRIVSDEPVSVSDPWRYAMNNKFPITSHPASPISYAIANRKVEIMKHKLPIRISPMRGVGGILNTFARESFIDELAGYANVDTLDYRLKMTDDPLGKGVLEAVAELSQWRTRGDRKLGIGYCDCDGVYVASAIEIASVDATGTIKVAHIYTAVDAGRLVLPYNANSQMEGAMIFALSNSLQERITFAEGVVQQTNFDSYHVLRMADTPELTYTFIDSDRDPKGVGDLAGMCVSAALANAFAAHTGHRIRHLPFTQERVLAAIGSSGYSST